MLGRVSRLIIVGIFLLLCSSVVLFDSQISKEELIVVLGCSASKLLSTVFPQGSREFMDPGSYKSHRIEDYCPASRPSMQATQKTFGVVGR